MIYTAVFFGPDGKPLPGGVQEVGWNRPRDPIPPGHTWRGTFLSGVEDAASLEAVLKEVVVLPPEPAPSAPSGPSTPSTGATPPTAAASGTSPSRPAARSALTPPPGSTVWTNPRHDAEVAALLSHR